MAWNIGVEHMEYIILNYCIHTLALCLEKGVGVERVVSVILQIIAFILISLKPWRCAS